MSYRTALTHVLSDVVAPRAEVTRARGAFPRHAVTALGTAGLLGLTVATELGGGGRGLTEAAAVVERTARACPATAAVLQAHYAAVAVVEEHGDPWLRGEIAAGRHLCSLALAEDDAGEPGVGTSLLSPHGTAEQGGGVVALCARKHQVVAAGEADLYLWSSRPVAARDGLSLWAVPAHAPDLFVPARPGRSGPPGSATSTVLADPAFVPAEALLGEDGGGLDILLRTVLPWLIELRAACGADEAAGDAESAPEAGVSLAAS
ncbi:acyl-CoA dehydrogenase family protein [Streptomyces sp. NPDC050400]|uniref:acyl-CoA dehydrogenase family protein n=1 Tax=Streptomyces sp. NPDC050400 TaxID=3365610 RepID=UPI00379E4E12